MALPDPVTRKEMYLNKAATGSGSVPPEPVTREEMYLAEIAAGGSGGGSQEPLVLTAVPSAAFVRGTVTGATAEEIMDAWVSGRPIRISLAAETLTMVESGAGEEYFELSAYLLFSDNFCKAIFHVFDMTYELKMYVLTPA